jgi:hypothetical protein
MTTTPPSGPNESDDLPAPTFVVAIDLDQPVPSIETDARYGSAMVVGWRDGIPVGAVDADLVEGRLADPRQLDPLLAIRRPAPPLPVADADLPSISVVVSTIVARAEDLELLLDGFAAVDYPDVEFLLVDNRRVIPEGDILPGLAAGRDRVGTVRALQPGISSGRNAGIAAARGEIVVFTDDDVRVDPRWLRSIGERFVREPALNAVTGLILPAELETPAQIWFERYYGGFSGERTFAPLTLSAERGGPRALRGSRVIVRDESGHEVRRFAVYGIGAYGAGANMAFRKSTLERLGGFDLALGTGTPSRGGEDLATLIDILWAGGSIGFEPSAVVHHKHRREVAELLHQLRGNGVGFTAMLTSLIVRHPRHLVGIGSQLPRALAAAGSQTVGRLVARGRTSTTAEVPAAGPGADGGSPYPRSFVVTEISSYALGPAAYRRSRAAARAWAVTRSGAGAPESGSIHSMK